MTTAQISVFEQINATVDQVLEARTAAMAQSAGPHRSLRLAELAELEAACWEALSEHSQTRVYWRAALVARDHARQAARSWRDQAVIQQTAAAVAEQLPEPAGVA